jgi:methylthioribose-1-phosphate isomerase
VRQKSSTSTTSFEREAVREKSIWDNFVQNAPAIGILVGFGTIIASGSFYVANLVGSLEKDLALAELKAVKDLEATELRAVKDLEATKQALVFAAKDLEAAKEATKQAVALVELKAAKDLEVAKMETAERFLRYGYAEEFQRYQKQAGIHKGGK